MFDKPKAFCGSLKCTNNYHVIRSTKQVEKKVSLSVNNCPDCGQTLVWKKSKYQKVKTTARGQKPDSLRDFSLNQ